MKLSPVLAALLLCAAAPGAFAQDASIKPEKLTIRPHISDGPHLFVLDFGMNGSSPIYVYDTKDFKLEGSIGTGSFGQMLMSPDKKTLYTASDYLSRYTYGTVESVIHEWDAYTLEKKREFTISPKMAQTISQTSVLNLTSDGDFLLVQNATPATSINVVDLKAGKDLVEIPTPGCWGDYPTLKGNAFTTICGDGKIVKYSFTADGKVAEPTKSAQIFDPDKDPIFTHGVRAGNDMIYVSYSGHLYAVDGAGDVPVVTKDFAFGEAGWAPSGNALLAYDPAAKLLFVQMHSNPSDGSHKNPAEEIWAVNLETEKVVGRSKANGETGIFLSGGDTPELFGIDYMGGAHRYEIANDGTGKLTLKNSSEHVAIFPTIAATDF
ncbi:hypothetical protein FGG78_07930 [Thioclava sp. BHET1]|nr:hypothetical protein FGG78_07930 [Thioclava sp. BHET1]